MFITSNSTINASELVLLARQTIEESLHLADTNLLKEKISNLEKKYSLKQGAFVTIKINHTLRGCIGYILPIKSLYATIKDCAYYAAFRDPRFKPLTEKEYPKIVLEISVLSIPEKIQTKNSDEIISKIKIGRHGIILSKKNNQGLLLPQVFTEYNTTPLQALEMTCKKAGLLKEEWKDKDTQISLFSAEVYQEITPYGKVIKIS